MNQKDYIGKTLKLWPVLVDHYTISILTHGSESKHGLTTAQS